MYKCEITLLNC